MPTHVDVIARAETAEFGAAAVCKDFVLAWFSGYKLCSQSEDLPTLTNFGPYNFVFATSMPVCMGVNHMQVSKLATKKFYLPS